MAEGAEVNDDKITQLTQDIENLKTEKESLLEEIENVKLKVGEKEKKIGELNAYIANHIVGAKIEDGIMSSNFNEIYRKTLKEMEAKENGL